MCFRIFVKKKRNAICSICTKQQINFASQAQFNHFLNNYYQTLLVTKKKTKNVESLGCWKDSKRHVFPSLEYRHHFLHDQYTKRSKAIEKCARVAIDHGFTMFALQDGGKCLGGPDGEKRFRIYGPSNLCKDGKGGKWSNNVYSTKTFHARSFPNEEATPWDAYCSRALDIVLLLDGSGETTELRRKRWFQMRHFVRLFMKGFDEHARFSIITYGGPPEILKDLQKPFTKDKMDQVLLKAEMPGGERTLNDGLKRAWREELKHNNRTAADKVIIAMTTGDVPFGLYGSSQFLSDHAVRVVVIGVDKNVHYEFLQSIASYRDVGNIFSVNSGQLDDIVPYIYRDVCNTMPEYVLATSPTPSKERPTEKTTPPPKNDTKPAEPEKKKPTEKSKDTKAKDKGAANSKKTNTTSAKGRGDIPPLTLDPVPITDGIVPVVTSAENTPAATTSEQKNSVPETNSFSAGKIPPAVRTSAYTAEGFDKKDTLPHTTDAQSNDDKTKKHLITAVKKGAPKEEVASMVLINPSPDLNLALTPMEAKEIEHRRETFRRDSSLALENELSTASNENSTVANKEIAENFENITMSQGPVATVENSTATEIKAENPPEVERDAFASKSHEIATLDNSTAAVSQNEQEESANRTVLSFEMPDTSDNYLEPLTQNVSVSKSNENEWEELPAVTNENKNENINTFKSEEKPEIINGNKESSIKESKQDADEEKSNSGNLKEKESTSLDKAGKKKESKENTLSKLKQSAEKLSGMKNQVKKENKTIEEEATPQIKNTSAINKKLEPPLHVSGTPNQKIPVKMFSSQGHEAPDRISKANLIDQSIAETSEDTQSNIGKMADSKINGVGAVSQTLELHAGNGKEHVGSHPSLHENHHTLFSGRLKDRMKADGSLFTGRDEIEQSIDPPESKQTLKKLDPKTLMFTNVTSLLDSAGKDLADIYEKIHKVEKTNQEIPDKKEGIFNAFLDNPNIGTLPLNNNHGNSVFDVDKVTTKKSVSLRDKMNQLAGNLNTEISRSTLTSKSDPKTQKQTLKPRVFSSKAARNMSVSRTASLNASLEKSLNKTISSLKTNFKNTTNPFRQHLVNYNNMDKISLKNKTQVAKNLANSIKPAQKNTPLPKTPAHSRVFGNPSPAENNMQQQFHLTASKFPTGWSITNSHGQKAHELTNVNGDALTVIPKSREPGTPKSNVFRYDFSKKFPAIMSAFNMLTEKDHVEAEKKRLKFDRRNYLFNDSLIGTDYNEGLFTESQADFLYLAENGPKPKFKSQQKANIQKATPANNKTKQFVPVTNNNVVNSRNVSYNQHVHPKHILPVGSNSNFMKTNNNDKILQTKQVTKVPVAKQIRNNTGGSLIRPNVLKPFISSPIKNKTKVSNFKPQKQQSTVQNKHEKPLKQTPTITEKTINAKHKKKNFKIDKKTLHTLSINDGDTSEDDIVRGNIHINGLKVNFITEEINRTHADEDSGDESKEDISVKSDHTKPSAVVKEKTTLDPVPPTESTLLVGANRESEMKPGFFARNSQPLMTGHYKNYTRMKPVVKIIENDDSGDSSIETVKMLDGKPLVGKSPAATVKNKEKQIVYGFNQANTLPDRLGTVKNDNTKAVKNENSFIEKQNTSLSTGNKNTGHNKIKIQITNNNDDKNKQVKMTEKDNKKPLNVRVTNKNTKAKNDVNVKKIKPTPSTNTKSKENNFVNKNVGKNINLNTKNLNKTYLKSNNSKIVNSKITNSNNFKNNMNINAKVKSNTKDTDKNGKNPNDLKAYLPFTQKELKIPDKKIQKVKALLTSFEKHIEKVVTDNNETVVNTPDDNMSFENLTLEVDSPKFENNVSPITSFNAHLPYFKPVVTQNANNTLRKKVPKQKTTKKPKVKKINTLTGLKVSEKKPIVSSLTDIKSPASSKKAESKSPGDKDEKGGISKFGISSDDMLIKDFDANIQEYNHNILDKISVLVNSMKPVMNAHIDFNAQEREKVANDRYIQNDHDYLSTPRPYRPTTPPKTTKPKTQKPTTMTTASTSTVFQVQFDYIYHPENGTGSILPHSTPSSKGGGGGGVGGPPGGFVINNVNGNLTQINNNNHFSNLSSPNIAVPSSDGKVIVTGNYENPKSDSRSETNSGTTTTTSTTSSPPIEAANDTTPTVKKNIQHVLKTKGPSIGLVESFYSVPKPPVAGQMIKRFAKNDLHQEINIREPNLHDAVYEFEQAADKMGSPVTNSIPIGNMVTEAVGYPFQPPSVSMIPTTEQRLANNTIDDVYDLQYSPNDATHSSLLDMQGEIHKVPIQPSLLGSHYKPAAIHVGNVEEEMHHIPHIAKPIQSFHPPTIQNQSLPGELHHHKIVPDDNDDDDNDGVDDDELVEGADVDDAHLEAQGENRPALLHPPATVHKPPTVQNISLDENGNEVHHHASAVTNDGHKTLPAEVTHAHKGPGPNIDGDRFHIDGPSISNIHASSSHLNSVHNPSSAHHGGGNSFSSPGTGDVTLPATPVDEPSPLAAHVSMHQMSFDEVKPSLESIEDQDEWYHVHVSKPHMPKLNTQSGGLVVEQPTVHVVHHAQQQQHLLEKPQQQLLEKPQPYLVTEPTLHHGHQQEAPLKIVESAADDHMATTSQHLHNMSPFGSHHHHESPTLDKIVGVDHPTSGHEGHPGTATATSVLSAQHAVEGEHAAATATEEASATTTEGALATTTEGAAATEGATDMHFHDAEMHHQGSQHLSKENFHAAGNEFNLLSSNNHVGHDDQDATHGLSKVHAHEHEDDSLHEHYKHMDKQKKLEELAHALHKPKESKEAHDALDKVEHTLLNYDYLGLNTLERKHATEKSGESRSPPTAKSHHHRRHHHNKRHHKKHHRNNKNSNKRESVKRTRQAAFLPDMPHLPPMHNFVDFQHAVRPLMNKHPRPPMTPAAAPDSTDILKHVKKTAVHSLRLNKRVFDNERWAAMQLMHQNVEGKTMHARHSNKTTKVEDEGTKAPPVIRVKNVWTENAFAPVKGVPMSRSNKTLILYASRKPHRENPTVAKTLQKLLWMNALDGRKDDTEVKFHRRGDTKTRSVFKSYLLRELEKYADNKVSKLDSDDHALKSGKTFERDEVIPQISKKSFWVGRTNGPFNEHSVYHINDGYVGDRTGRFKVRKPTVQHRVFHKQNVNPSKKQQINLPTSQRGKDYDLMNLDSDLPKNVIDETSSDIMQMTETADKRTSDARKTTPKRSEATTTKKLLTIKDFPRSFLVKDFNLADLPSLPLGKSYVLATPSIGTVTVKIKADESSASAEDITQQKEESYFTKHASPLQFYAKDESNESTLEPTTSKPKLKTSESSLATIMESNEPSTHGSTHKTAVDKSEVNQTMSNGTITLTAAEMRRFKENETLGDDSELSNMVHAVVKNIANESKAFMMNSGNITNTQSKNIFKTGKSVDNDTLVITGFTTDKNNNSTPLNKTDNDETIPDESSKSSTKEPGKDSRLAPKKLSQSDKLQIDAKSDSIKETKEEDKKNDSSDEKDEESNKEMLLNTHHKYKTAMKEKGSHDKNDTTRVSDEHSNYKNDTNDLTETPLQQKLENSTAPESTSEPEPKKGEFKNSTADEISVTMKMSNVTTETIDDDHVTHNNTGTRMTAMEYMLGCNKPLRILYAIDVSDGLGEGLIRKKRWSRLKDFISNINSEVIKGVANKFMVFNIEPRFLHSMDGCDRSTEYFLTADDCLCGLNPQTRSTTTGCSVNGPTTMENIEDWGKLGPRTGHALDKAREIYFRQDLGKFKNIIFLISHKQATDDLKTAEMNLKRDGISLVDIELGDRHDLRKRHRIPRRHRIAIRYHNNNNNQKLSPASSSENFDGEKVRRSRIERRDDGDASGGIPDEHKVKVSLKKLQQTLRNIVGKVCKSQSEDDNSDN